MSKARKSVLGGAVIALAGAASIVFGASPAAADNVGGGTDASGPFVKVHVTYSGDVRGSHTSSPSLPAKCWWTPIAADVLLGDPPIDANDPESAAKYFQWALENNNGTFSFARLSLPSPNQIADAIRRVQAGEKITWYYGQCVKDVDPIKSGFLQKGGTFQGTDIAVAFQAFPTGAAPEPVIAAETLALDAVQHLLIDPPQLDRNPKIGLGGTDAALVTLPTYFWLDNVDEALGTPVGKKEITATAGNASATVHADSSGIGITGPDGSLQKIGDCTAAKIATPYTQGASPDSLCGVKFLRASVGRAAGWPINVASEWKVYWDGNEADGTPAGGLDFTLPLAGPTDTTINVPVAESQAVVDRTDS